MCQEHLDIDQRPGTQKRALEKIKNRVNLFNISFWFTNHPPFDLKLEAELPDLFVDDEVAMYLALKTAMKYHHNRRAQERDRMAKSEKEKKVSILIDVNSKLH